MIAGLVAVELWSPLAIEVTSLANLAIACVALGAAAIFYARVRINPKLSASCVCLVQALLFSTAGSILSYLLARSGGVLWDATFLQWDRALGLDWIGYVRFVDAHAWTALAFRFAYASLIPQIVVVILALGFSGRLDQLRAFVFAAIASGLIAILLSPLFPALGNYAHLGLAASDFQRVWPWANLADVRDVLALRSGQLASIDVGRMQGIIVFPSYHACLAVLTLWAFWKSGIAALRWIGAAVALTTLAATPVDGGHYFVDVIAGIAIALASIAAATRVVFVKVRMPALRALPSRRSREAFAR